MTFNSWEFLVFFPIVAFLYFLLPKRAKWPMLLIASYYFYMFYQPELVILILSTTLVSWLSAFAIERTEKRGLKKLFLALTLTVCLGVLFFFKYFNFLFGSVASLASVLGIETPRLVLELVLPVGISFYTFQTLSYVIDVYRGEIECERNFFLYALFVSFFPQLVAGPIERPGNLIPQLRETHSLSRDNLVAGVKYMLLGFFKKICVADALSVYVDSVYNNPEGAPSFAIIIATLMFAVQIYCDFSGYTDIATGCARIMGIRLMKNFDHPYSAVSVKDFWSRWHISLSGWFRDYLYIPLGGNRCSRARHLFNLFFVFLVSGLWHGASFTFVLWGAVHGIYRVIGTLTLRKRNSLIERLGKSPDSRAVRAVRRVITFILVTFAWIFFRANSLHDAGVLLLSLVSCHGGLTEALSLMGLGTVEILTSVFSVAALFSMDRIMTRESEDTRDCLTSRGAFIYYVWIIAVVWLLLLSRGLDSTFIYFRF